MMQHWLDNLAEWWLRRRWGGSVTTTAYLQQLQHRVAEAEFALYRERNRAHQLQQTTTAQAQEISGLQQKLAIPY